MAIGKQLESLQSFHIPPNTLKKQKEYVVVRVLFGHAVRIDATSSLR